MFTEITPVQIHNFINLLDGKRDIYPHEKGDREILIASLIVLSIMEYEWYIFGITVRTIVVVLIMTLLAVRPLQDHGTKT